MEKTYRYKNKKKKRKNKIKNKKNIFFNFTLFILISILFHQSFGTEIGPIINNSINITNDTIIKNNIICNNLTCFKIINNNIKINCNNHFIVSNNSKVGFELYNKKNITILNCQFVNFKYGILDEKSTKLNFTNNKFYNSSLILNYSKGIFYNNYFYNSSYLKYSNTKDKKFYLGNITNYYDNTSKGPIFNNIYLYSNLLIDSNIKLVKDTYKNINNIKINNHITLNCQNSTITGNKNIIFSNLIANDYINILNCNFKNYKTVLNIKYKIYYTPGTLLCCLRKHYNYPENIKIFNNKFLNNTLSIKIDKGKNIVIFNNTFINYSLYDFLKKQIKENNKLKHNYYKYKYDIDIINSNTRIYNNTFINTSLKYNTNSGNSFCFQNISNKYINVLGPTCNCGVVYSNFNIYGSYKICPYVYYNISNVGISSNSKLNGNKAIFIGNKKLNLFKIEHQHNTKIINLSIKNYKTGIHVKDKYDYKWRQYEGSNNNYIENVFFDNNSYSIYVDAYSSNTFSKNCFFLGNKYNIYQNSNRKTYLKNSCFFNNNKSIIEKTFNRPKFVSLNILKTNSSFINLKLNKNSLISKVINAKNKTYLIIELKNLIKTNHKNYNCFYKKINYSIILKLNNRILFTKNYEKNFYGNLKTIKNKINLNDLNLTKKELENIQIFILFNEKKSKEITGFILKSQLKSKHNIIFNFFYNNSKYDLFNVKKIVNDTLNEKYNFYDINYNQINQKYNITLNFYKSTKNKTNYEKRINKNYSIFNIYLNNTNMKTIILKNKNEIIINTSEYYLPFFLNEIVNILNNYDSSNILNISKIYYKINTSFYSHINQKKYKKFYTIIRNLSSKKFSNINKNEINDIIQNESVSNNNLIKLLSVKIDSNFLINNILNHNLINEKYNIINYKYLFNISSLNISNITNNEAILKYFNKIKKTYIIKIIEIKPINLTYKDPIIMAGGLWSDSDTFKKLSLNLSNQGFDCFLIELTGDNFENKNSIDYNYKFLEKYKLPLLIKTILNITNRNNYIYIGHSNGARTFIDSLSHKYINEKKVDSAFLLGIPGKFEKLTPLTLIINKTGKKIINIYKKENKHHIKISDLIFVGNINPWYLNFDWMKLSNKISLNLFDQYFKWIKYSNDTNPGNNVSIKSLNLIYGNQFIDSDSIVPVVDEKKIYNKIDGINKRLYQVNTIHIGMSENKDIINIINEVLKNEIFIH